MHVKKTYSGDERAFCFYLGVALKNTLYDVVTRQKCHSVLISFDEKITPAFFAADIVEEMPDERRSDAKMFRAVRRAWCSLTDDQRSRARVLLEPQKYGAVGRYAKARGESLANFSMKLCKIKRILRSRIMESVKDE